MLSTIVVVTLLLVRLAIPVTVVLLIGEAMKKNRSYELYS